MTGVPVRDVHDGVVRACDPPKHSVLLTLKFENRRTGVYEVHIGETTGLGREDIILRRGDRLVVILGPEGYKPSPSWHLVDPSSDQVLATVRMPPNTSTVLQTFIVDRRAFGNANGGTS